MQCSTTIKQPIPSFQVRFPRTRPQAPRTFVKTLAALAGSAMLHIRFCTAAFRAKAPRARDASRLFSEEALLFPASTDHTNKAAIDDPAVKLAPSGTFANTTRLGR